MSKQTPFPTIVTRGPFDNVFDLLHLRGVDLAIVSGDILDFFQKDPAGPAIAKKLAYVVPLVLVCALVMAQARWLETETISPVM